MPAISRRKLLRLGAAATVAVGIPAVGMRAANAQPVDDPRPNADVETQLEDQFDETYKGRRIRSTAIRTRSSATTSAPTVYVDDMPLHVMVDGDGKYTSIVNHYQSFDSLRETAQAAVDELGGAQLVHIHHR